MVWSRLSLKFRQLGRLTWRGGACGGLWLERRPAGELVEIPLPHLASVEPERRRQMQGTWSCSQHMVERAQVCEMVEMAEQDGIEPGTRRVVVHRAGDRDACCVVGQPERVELDERDEGANCRHGEGPRRKAPERLASALRRKNGAGSWPSCSHCPQLHLAPPNPRYARGLAPAPTSL